MTEPQQLDPMTVLASKQADLEGQLAKMTDAMTKLMEQNTQLMQTNAKLVQGFSAPEQAPAPQQEQKQNDAELQKKQDDLAFDALCRQLGINNKKE